MLWINRGYGISVQAYTAEKHWNNNSSDTQVKSRFLYLTHIFTVYFSMSSIVAIFSSGGSHNIIQEILQSEEYCSENWIKSKKGTKFVTKLVWDITIISGTAPKILSDCSSSIHAKESTVLEESRCFRSHWRNRPHLRRSTRRNFCPTQTRAGWMHLKFLTRTATKC